MDLASRKQLKALLKKYDIQPQKRLGQHFLVDKRVLQKILDAAAVQREDTVVEVGPGPGVLTRELAQRAKKVIAVEKDRNIIPLLQEVLKEHPNVELIEGDILRLLQKSSSPTKTSFDARQALKNQTGNAVRKNVKNYKVVANLPYSIVAPVIRLFLESKNPPKKMVLMVQKEVAQRITATPPRMNLLAVSVQFYAAPKIISYVSKKSFWPQPKVDSAIIQLTPLAQVPSRSANQRRANAFRMKFFKIVRCGFSHPRKQLANNLSHMLKKDRAQIKEVLLRNGVNPSARAETLPLTLWIKLARAL